MGYGVVRIVVEFFRTGASSEIGWLGFTYAQWLSVAMIVAGAALWQWKPKKRT
jgi:prolipoprotein diacylglyceryltransferase